LRYRYNSLTDVPGKKLPASKIQNPNSKLQQVLVIGIWSFEIGFYNASFGLKYSFQIIAAMNQSFRFLLFSFLVFTSFTLLQAQSIEKKYTLFFETNSSELSPVSKASLDSLVGLLENAGFYSVELTAHTDQKGSNGFNEILSAKRENVASSYLIESGLIASRLNGQHFGEAVPALNLDNTEDIPENRRVEIKVRYQVFEGVEEVLKFTSVQSEQAFQFEDDGIQEVKGEKGTQLLIPSDAFQTADGKLVSNKDVVFVLEEFPGLGHAIQNQLTTLSGGQILESGGMFKMEATYQGEPLELRTGKKIDVQMPSDNMQKGMKVFVGNRDENGAVVWEETKEEFKGVDTTPAPKFLIPNLAETLKSNRVPLGDYPVYTAMKWDLIIPEPPTAPRMPKEPVSPVVPKAPEGDNPGIMSFFHSEWRDYNKAEKRYQSKLKSYTKRYEQYERGMERYHAYRAQYVIDSAQYILDDLAFKQTVELMQQDRLELLEKFYAYYHAMRFDGVLNSLSNKATDSVLYSSTLLMDIRKGANGSIRGSEWNYMQTIYAHLNFLQVLSQPDIIQNRKLIAKGNTLDWPTFQRSLKYHKLHLQPVGTAYPDINRFSSQNTCYVSFMQDTAAWKEIQGYQKQILAKKKELGIFDRSDVGNVYEASLGRMGYINCDRFADISPNLMAKLDVNVPPGSKLFVVIPRINSMIPLYSGHDSTSMIKLPIGEEIKIVSIGTHNGRPTLDYRKMTLKAAGNAVLLTPKKVQVEYLEKFLEEL